MEAIFRGGYREHKTYDEGRYIADDHDREYSLDVSVEKEAGNIRHDGIAKCAHPPHGLIVPPAEFRLFHRDGIVNAAQRGGDYAVYESEQNDRGNVPNDHECGEDHYGYDISDIHYQVLGRGSVRNSSQDRQRDQGNELGYAVYNAESLYRDTHLGEIQAHEAALYSASAEHDDVEDIEYPWAFRVVSFEFSHFCHHIILYFFLRLF